MCTYFIQIECCFSSVMKDLFHPLMVGFEIPHIGSVGTTQMLIVRAGKRWAMPLAEMYYIRMTIERFWPRPEPPRSSLI